MNSARFFVCSVLAILVAVCSACSKSDGPAEPNTGEIVVDAQPSDLNSAWEIVGPNGLYALGAGDSTLAGAPIGSYSIRWGPAFGWMAPDSVAQVLAANGSIRFSGTYIPLSGWLRFEFPSSDFTDVWGMSNGRAIGNYVNDTGWHSYSFDGEQWVSLPTPGSVVGADDSGIIGNYFESELQRGFRFAGEHWYAIANPSGIHTEIYDIDDGRIVGRFYSDSSISHGFRFDGATWSQIDAPGASKTVVTGIDGTWLAGNALVSGTWHGFVFDGSAWEFIDSPDQSRLTVWGIDQQRVVGFYGDHGFVASTTDFVSIDVPGATWTQVTGLEGSLVFGKFKDGTGKIYGFATHMDSLP